MMKMSLEAIRSASAEEFANVRKDAPETSETTPPAITKEIREFAGSLAGAAPAYVPVVQDQHGLYGWCSDGVHAKVAADGGSVALGWTIWEWPNVLLTAEFHAAWRDERGNLFDITPKPGGEQRIVFVEDSSYPQNFDFDQRPRNRRRRLYKVADPDEAVKGLKAKLVGAKLAYEEGRSAKAGVTLEEWLKRKLPNDVLAEAIDEVIASCNEFEEHFDSLGTAGPVRADEKLVGLAKRRVAAQARMKKLLKQR